MTTTPRRAERRPGGDGVIFTLRGHPPALSTLFLTAMGERFSYYGMRALLVLYVTASTCAHGSEPLTYGGLGFDKGTATAIYALYASLVYILALPGGWIADNLWGQRKAVWVGGWIIAGGQFAMAVPTTGFFFLGLASIACGTGLLKPNVSALVGTLYSTRGARRDSGFSLFYMGINVGAFLGPLITSSVATGDDWHWGFGAAGVGMVLGLAAYRWGPGGFGVVRQRPTAEAAAGVAAIGRMVLAGCGAIGVVGVAYGVFVARGSIAFGVPEIATGLGYGTLGLVALYFGYVWIAGDHTVQEKRQLGVIVWLFLLNILFWTGFEQAGTSLNLFAQHNTDRSILGWSLPAPYLQSINPAFIIVLAPVFGTLWVWLEQRRVNPSIPRIAGLGLLSLAIGFFVLAWDSDRYKVFNFIGVAVCNSIPRETHPGPARVCPSVPWSP